MEDCGEEEVGVHSMTPGRGVRKRPPYWRELKDPRLQDPSKRRSLLEMRRDNSPLRRLGGSNWGSTTGVP